MLTLLTTVAEVDFIDIMRPFRDVIDTRDRDVISAEGGGWLAQDALEPASSARAKQRIVLYCTSTMTCTQHVHDEPENVPL